MINKALLVFVKFLFICLMVLDGFDRMIDKLARFIEENQNTLRALYLVVVGALMSIFFISMFELAT